MYLKKKDYLKASNISKTTPIIKSNVKNIKNTKLKNTKLKNTKINNTKLKNNTKLTPKKTLMQKFNKILYD